MEARPASSRPAEPGSGVAVVEVSEPELASVAGSAIPGVEAKLDGSGTWPKLGAAGFLSGGGGLRRASKGGCPNKPLARPSEVK